MHRSSLVHIEYLYQLESAGKNRVERREAVLDYSSQSEHPLMLAGRCGMDHGKSTLLSEAMDVKIPVLKIEILLPPNVPPKHYGI